MPLVLSAGAILYFGGQIALWGLLFGTSNLPGEASNRRFQFSLRRLLLTITLIAIALACLPNNDPFLQAIGVAALSVAGIVVAEPGRHHSAPRP